MLEADLVSLMGGRVAEELISSDVTTGAHNDIERATMIARAMVCEYGMSKLLGPQNLGSHSKPVFLGQGINGAQNFSEETSQKIDQEVQRILGDAYAATMKILTDNKERLVSREHQFRCICLMRSNEVTRVLFLRAYHFGGVPDGGRDHVRTLLVGVERRAEGIPIPSSCHHQARLSQA